MKWLYLLALPLTFALAAPTSAGASACDKDASNPRCICPMYYDPVCGMDGKIYSNTCDAACECMDIAYAGECDDACTKYCGDTAYAPVCGADGETYGNECYAECLEVKIDHEGACLPYVSPGQHP